MLIGMTNEMQQTRTMTTTTARRAGRAVTVAAGAAGSLLVWAVNGPGAGRDLAVRQGDTTQQIGPVAVVATALLAGLAAWALLAALERFTRRPVRTYRIIALVVLAVSRACAARRRGGHGQPAGSARHPPDRRCGADHRTSPAARLPLIPHGRWWQPCGRAPPGAGPLPGGEQHTPANGTGPRAAQAHEQHRPAPAAPAEGRPGFPGCRAG